MPDGIVHDRDQYSVTLTCLDESGQPANLSGAMVTLMSRLQYPRGHEYETLQTKPGTADGKVTHIFDGTLPEGTHEWKVVATWAGVPPTIITFPTDQGDGPQFVTVKVV